MSKARDDTCDTKEARRRDEDNMVEHGRNLPDATNVPILVENIFVNELAMFGVLEIRLNDEFAEVDLSQD